MTMAILLSNSSDNAPWRAMFEQLLPNMTVYEYGEKFNAAHIRYAAVWDHPHGDLATYPNFKRNYGIGFRDRPSGYGSDVAAGTSRSSY